VDSSKEVKQRLSGLDQLYADIAELRVREHFEEMIRFVNKFPNIAPYNAMLLYQQCPGSEFVFTPAVWSKYRRYPKPGARPLVILRPFGPVEFVYEYNDTEGEPLPDSLVRPFKDEHEIPHENFVNLIEYMKLEGIDYIPHKYGTGMAGRIQKVVKPNYMQFSKPSSKKCKIIKSRFCINCNSNLNETEQFMTLLHELGHHFCGHLKLKEYTWIEDRQKPMSAVVAEFEAETVDYLVCQRMGIKSKQSIRYLNRYVGDDNAIPKGASIECILKAVDRIESMMRGEYVGHKELVAEEIKKEVQQNLF